MSSWWHGGTPEQLQEKAKRPAAPAPVKGPGLLKWDSSILKSVMQKCIRRSMTADAQAIAKALIDTGNISTLRRRLPVICAEDVGWRKMWIAPICGDEDCTADDLLKMVAVLSEGEKDKSCEPLIGESRRQNAKSKPGPPAEFLGHLAAGRIQEASRVVVHELDPVEKGTGVLWIWPDLIAAARAMEVQRPGVTAVVEAVKRRLGMGLFQNDRSLMTIAAVQAICGRTYDNSPVEGWEGQFNWKNTPIAPADRKGLADLWWAMDPHGWVGKITGGILKKKYPAIFSLGDEWLAWGWFIARDVGSGIVTPARDQKYMEDWDLQHREKFGETLDEATRKFKELMPEIESVCKWLMRQRGLE